MAKSAMAKSKKAIPKRAVGTKVPKSTRKSNDSQSPLKGSDGRDMAANALMAAAGASAAVLVANRDKVAEIAKQGAKKGAEAAAVVAEAVRSAAAAAVDVVTDTARSVLSPKEETPNEEKSEKLKRGARH